MLFLPWFSFSFLFLPYLWICTGLGCSISEFWQSISHMTSNRWNTEHFHQHRMFPGVPIHSLTLATCHWEKNKFYVSLFFKSLRSLRNTFFLIITTSPFSSPSRSPYFPCPNLCPLNKQTKKHQVQFLLPIYPYSIPLEHVWLIVYRSLFRSGTPFPSPLSMMGFVSDWACTGLMNVAITAVSSYVQCLLLS